MIPGADIKLGRQEGAENQNWVGVNIYGDDPSKLQEIAREARTRLRPRPGFSEIHTDSDKGREEVQIRLDRELGEEVQHLLAIGCEHCSASSFADRRFAAIEHRKAKSTSGCACRQATDRTCRI